MAPKLRPKRKTTTRVTRRTVTSAVKRVDYEVLSRKTEYKEAVEALWIARDNACTETSLYPFENSRDSIGKIVQQNIVSNKMLEVLNNHYDSFDDFSLIIEEAKPPPRPSSTTKRASVPTNGVESPLPKAEKSSPRIDVAEDTEPVAGPSTLHLASRNATPSCVTPKTPQRERQSKASLTTVFTKASRRFTSNNLMAVPTQNNVYVSTPKQAGRKSFRIFLSPIAKQSNHAKRSKSRLSLIDSTDEPLILPPTCETNSVVASSSIASVLPETDVLNNSVLDETLFGFDEAEEAATASKTVLAEEHATALEATAKSTATTLLSLRCDDGESDADGQSSQPAFGDVVFSGASSLERESRLTDDVHESSMAPDVVSQLPKNSIDEKMSMESVSVLQSQKGDIEMSSIENGADNVSQSNSSMFITANTQSLQTSFKNSLNRTIQCDEKENVTVTTAIDKTLPSQRKSASRTSLSPFEQPQNASIISSTAEAQAVEDAELEAIANHRDMSESCISNFTIAGTSRANDSCRSDITVGSAYTTFTVKAADPNKQLFYLEGFTGESNVLNHLCFVAGQSAVQPWRAATRQLDLGDVKKIGEGTFGEVYVAKYNGIKVALKVFPFRESEDPSKNYPMINENEMMPAASIMSEIVVTKTLSELSESDSRSPNFVPLHKTFVVKGTYPKELLNAWHDYDKTKGSENTCPSDYSSVTRHYIVMALGFGGINLEDYVVKSYNKAMSILLQIALAMTVAELELEFEHRDLHWGNILVCEDDVPSFIEYVIDGNVVRVHSHGVKVIIIDFTNSRIFKDGVIVYVDLSQDECLFQGEGDMQFQVYRDMREVNSDNWSLYKPETNVLWLEYLVDKLFNGIAGKRPKFPKKQRDNALTQFNFLRSCNNTSDFLKQSLSIFEDFYVTEPLKN